MNKLCGRGARRTKLSDVIVYYDMSTVYLCITSLLYLTYHMSLIFPVHIALSSGWTYETLLYFHFHYTNCWYDSVFHAATLHATIKYQRTKLTYTLYFQRLHVNKWWFGFTLICKRPEPLTQNLDRVHYALLRYRHSASFA